MDWEMRLRTLGYMFGNPGLHVWEPWVTCFGTLGYMLGNPGLHVWEPWFTCLGTPRVRYIIHAETLYFCSCRKSLYDKHHIKYGLVIGL